MMGGITVEFIIWVIIGGLIACLAAILLGIQIIADHAVIISIVLGLVCFLIIVFSAEKGEKLLAVSQFSILSSSIYSASSYLKSVKAILDGAGGFVDLIFCIVGGAFGTVIMFGICCFFVGSQADVTMRDEKNRQIIWNLFVKTPVAFLVLWGLRKFFGY